MDELLDSDISHEFHRESHHIHAIPRPEISEVGRSGDQEFRRSGGQEVRRSDGQEVGRSGGV